MKAILLAKVDLLWNGGIGTYVKSIGETNAEVGDRANDAIRVNGRATALKVVGEGGNLGCTQLGRIEAARRGCGSTPTPSTTPPASTPATTRSTSRSSSGAWCGTAT
jgi:NAD-specific glutamate dehydrogenase